VRGVQTYPLQPQKRGVLLVASQSKEKKEDRGQETSGKRGVTSGRLKKKKKLSARALIEKVSHPSFHSSDAPYVAKRDHDGSLRRRESRKRGLLREPLTT